MNERGQVQIVVVLLFVVLIAGVGLWLTIATNSQAEQALETARQQGAHVELAEPATIEVSAVSVLPLSFNPSLDQSATVRFELSEAADVTVAMYGPNNERVATLIDGSRLEAGKHTADWDGRDDAGHPVPDEAWYVRIDANNTSGWGRWDPLAHSGGDRLHPTSIEISRMGDTISYVVPKAARVLVRAGIEDGPSLNTVLNWRPRAAGQCVEIWKGFDQQGARYFRAPDIAAIVSVQCYGLPEASIISTGNRAADYFDWYMGHGASLPVKEEVERLSVLDGTTSRHWGLPPHLDKDPAVTLAFPQVDPSDPEPGQAIMLDGDDVLVRMDVPVDAARDFISNQRFELVTFLDDVRIGEDEMAHLPYNWSWNLSDVPDGEHWLTVNLVTFQQHVGIATQRVNIQRGDPPAASADAGDDQGDDK